MTGGLGGGYRSPGASEDPIEGADEHEAARSEFDGVIDPSPDLHDEESGARADDAAPVPHVKPFRGWGAAQEAPGPTLWERVRAWFARGTPAEPSNDSADVSETLSPWTAPAGRSSFDDLDAPWADPLPGNERRSSRPSSERPSVDDFQTTWDGAYDSEEAAAEETAQQSTASHDGDPLWDAPAVSGTIAETPRPFAADDVSAVWGDRGVAPEPATASREELEKKPGFFARLFGRKATSEAAADERANAAAAAWATDIAELTEEASREPADADFADDTAAATAPAASDFEDHTPPPPSFAERSAPAVSDFDDRSPAPSTDHSPEDAANLAALLGPVTPSREEAFDEPTEQIPEARPSILEETSLDRKPGFFSSLLKRVSRSQFMPKPPAEPEPSLEAEVIDELEVSSVESVEMFVEEAPPAETASAETVDLRWAPPPPPDAAIEPEPEMEQDVAPEAPFMPEPAPATHADLESTQPFPAFRDARDDFADEAADDDGEGGRRTEEVELASIDDGEKTDEFEVVPGLQGDPSVAEAETVGFFGRVFGKKPVEVEKTEEPEAQVPQHTIAEDDGKVPFVLAKFRSFYNEVIRDKHQKSDVISGFATAILSTTPENTADPEFAAQLLSKRLSEMLELQAAESNWTGGDAAKYYPEAQYAMVALADETFATIDWPGRSSWHKYMLEPRMYGTRGADIEFFKRIDKLLKDNPDPPKGARDLARVYLLVIASGFRGKFRVPNVRRPLAEYRRRLYEFSHRVDPLELYARDRRILPDAFAHTLESRAVGRFSSAQKWVAAVLILAVLYLGVSQFAWARLSAELKDVMARIELTGAAGGKTP